MKSYVFIGFFIFSTHLFANQKLITLIENQDLVRFKAVLATDPTVKLNDSTWGNTPLIAAVKVENIEMIKALLVAGSHPDVSGSSSQYIGDGYSSPTIYQTRLFFPLTVALNGSKSNEIANLLLDYNADVNVSEWVKNESKYAGYSGSDGNPVLAQILGRKNPDFQLLSRMMAAQVKLQWCGGGFSCYQMASLSGKGTAEILLENKSFDPEKLNSMLFWLVMANRGYGGQETSIANNHRSFDVIFKYADHRSIPVDCAGLINLSAEFNDPYLISALAEKCSINSVVDGQTALIRAVTAYPQYQFNDDGSPNLEGLKLLVELKADLEYIDDTGWTALTYAKDRVKKGELIFAPVVKLLKDAGAQP